MQTGITELGGSAIVLAGWNQLDLEHRDGVVMDGDKTEHVAEFVRYWAAIARAIGVRTFAALKNWKETCQDPVLRALQNIPRFR